MLSTGCEQPIHKLTALKAQTADAMQGTREKMSQEEADAFLIAIEYTGLSITGQDY